MEKIQNAPEDLVRLITKLVIEKLREREGAVPIGVSNRHVHLDRADMDVLFGPGSELTKLKDLGQPGQYACAETVTIKGPRGSLKHVRVLGPLRKESQVEISVSDGYALGVKAPVRESGQLSGTPGIVIIGPKGYVEKDRGVIVALRHIHMTPEIAQRLGVADKDIVSTRFDGPRGGLMRNVLVRVSDQFALEMHVDVEEANAFGMKNGDLAYIMRE